MTRLSSLFLLLLLVACSPAPEEPEPPSVISGTVVYRERMALPPDAMVTVRLEDVSRMDVAAELLAETRFPAESGPPYAFSLAFDPGQVLEGRRYALRASISLGDRLMFTSTDHLPAFEQTEGVEILVRRTGG